MNQELKDKLWRSSKPAGEWAKSYFVIPVLDAIELIEGFEKDTKDNKEDKA